MERFCFIEVKTLTKVTLVPREMAGHGEEEGHRSVARRYVRRLQSDLIPPFQRKVVDTSQSAALHPARRDHAR